MTSRTFARAGLAVAVLLGACGGGVEEPPGQAPTSDAVLTDTVAAGAATPSPRVTPPPASGGRVLTSTVRVADGRTGADGCRAAVLPEDRLPPQPLGAGELAAMTDRFVELSEPLAAVSTALRAEVDTGAATVKLVATSEPRLVVATTRALLADLCATAVAAAGPAADAVEVWCCDVTAVGTESVIGLAVRQFLHRDGDAVVSRRERPDGRLTMVLAADAIDVAERVRARFGSLVELRLGHLPYPLVDDGDPAVSACGTIGSGRPLTELGLEIVRVEVSPPADPGLDRLLTVTVRNPGRRPVTLVNPHVTATTGPGRSVQLGAPIRRLPVDTAIEDRLEAGGERILTAPVGTASCVPLLGHVLPPGEYEAVLFMTVGTETAELRAPFAIT